MAGYRNDCSGEICLSKLHNMLLRLPETAVSLTKIYVDAKEMPKPQGEAYIRTAQKRWNTQHRYMTGTFGWYHNGGSALIEVDLCRAARVLIRDNAEYARGVAKEVATTIAVSNHGGRFDAFNVPISFEDNDRKVWVYYKTEVKSSK